MEGALSTTTSTWTPQNTLEAEMALSAEGWGGHAEGGAPALTFSCGPSTGWQKIFLD